MQSQKLTGKLPLVLHGGTGIPDDMIKKAIDLGVAKINVNTECQLFICRCNPQVYRGRQRSGRQRLSIRVSFSNRAHEAIIETVKEKMELFGSVGKAE